MADGASTRPLWRRKKLIALGAVVVALPVAHLAVQATTSIDPPSVVVPAGVGTGYTRVVGGVREAFLTGTPEQIGSEAARLLRDPMVDAETDLWGDFARMIPTRPARALLLDISRVRYRHIDRGIPAPLRTELAAEASAFAPDPFASTMPTYQRMVFAHALYDIALGFEHSPLIGCTAFGLGAGATKDGHVLLGRAFDFEAADVLDRDKVVYFVAKDGAIPFASVAWPGLVGVVSGMNLEGVAVIVNGGRAREPVSEGEPVVYSLREVLEQAHDTREAVAVLQRQKVMVSHIVFVADASGAFAVVERAPGVEAFVKSAWSDPDRVAVTNHFEGPLAADEKNQTVRHDTTTLARKARIDEDLAQVGPREADVARAVAILRDHDCAGGVSCPLGDRRAIDALIATHGIVADTTDRTLWVSAGPHLSGQFVKFDLRAIFAPEHDPTSEPPPEIIEADPVLSTAAYAIGLSHGGARGR
jgi:isopenicillin-N N-acyltransferase like protein